MTDEEKAEVRYCKTCKKKNNCFHNCDVFIEYTKGIAEGRKEIEKVKTEKYFYKKDTQELEKENAELKKEISVLLSCANCQENKGGYVCEKEYNDKCLAQKIEYIKELKEENAELKAQIKKMKFDIKIEAERNAYISQATLNHLLEQWESAE